MPRFFAWVALSQTVLFVGAAVLGLISQDAVGLQRHLGLGVFASLLACLIHAGVFTYFTVTGKLMTQGLTLGRLDAAPIFQAKRYKRSVTRFVGLAMLSLLAVVATGAWRAGGPVHRAWHLVTAAIVMIVHPYVFYRQYDLIVRNDRLLTEVMFNYRAARQARRREEEAETAIP